MSRSDRDAVEVDVQKTKVPQGKVSFSVIICIKISENILGKWRVVVKHVQQACFGANCHWVAVAKCGHRCKKQPSNESS